MNDTFADRPAAAGPRLGAALTIGADAAICVHVHTSADGITTIWDKLNDLNETAGSADERVSVVAVLGVDVAGRDDAAVHEFEIPADAVDELAAAALAVNL